MQAPELVGRARQCGYTFSCQRAVGTLRGALQRVVWAVLALTQVLPAHTECTEAALLSMG